MTAKTKEAKQKQKQSQRQKLRQKQKQKDSMSISPGESRFLAEMPVEADVPASTSMEAQSDRS
jgi:hypothetical protein